MLEDLGLIVLKGFEDRAEKLNKYICELTGDNKDYIIKIDNPRFGNGESKVVIKETVRNKDLFIIADVGNYSCTYSMYGKENRLSPDDHFLDIIRTISAINGKAKRITLILPLMYSSRQHRRKGRESLDCSMALKYLEFLGVNNIITFDVHDPEMQNAIPTGSFDSIFPIYSILKEFIKNEKAEISKDKLIVISPDVGAMERARRYSSTLNLDLGLYYKRRDYTQVIDGKNPIIQHEYIGPDVNGKSILIIDDMLSSGESIIDIANIMKGKGCKNIYVITSFAFFTNGIEKFDEYYKQGLITKIYSTNASYLNPKLKNKNWFCGVDITDFIAKIIYIISRNQSLGSIIDPADKLRGLIDSIKS